ncbi:FAD-binding oxidoreductase [Pseudolysinimonas kribbensis]|uniref:FAD-binding oxidoreductase n=1 Tax=Pseudolysinimonas kribbensis TaxID=433641 RepID=UPI0032AE846E
MSSGRGIVIDLAELRDVEILDESGGIVRVGGGATWGDVVDVLQPRGLAISAGDTKSVGVGGLTLSGGIGWKVRRYGLALDSLLAVEIVTADGRLVRADTAELPDLFWAVRGGGGNFGVVTAFEFRAHRTTRVHFGRIAFAPAGRRQVLRGWAAHLRDAPDALTSIANLANPVAGGPDAPVEVFVAFDGDDPAEAGRAIDPLRRLGTVVADEVAIMPYDQILEPGGTPPPGIAFLTRSGFVDAASTAAMLDLLSDTSGSAGSPFISSAPSAEPSPACPGRPRPSRIVRPTSW